MICCVVDTTGCEMARGDITGSQWTAAHNGFVNTAPISLRSHKVGQPATFVLKDYLGITLCKIPMGPGIDLPINTSITFMSYTIAFGVFHLETTNENRIPHT